MTVVAQSGRPIRTVHVYLAFPDEFCTDQHRTGLQALLDDTERQRRSRFVFERSRDEFLVAHALVRLALQRHGNHPAHSWRFVTDEHGRPFVEGPATASEMHFNLSHTRGLVACVVSDTKLCGVDVEEHRHTSDLVQLAQRFFSAAEAADIADCHVDQRTDRFFSYWTLKESYIKARGLGLALDLGSFSFELGSEVAVSCVPGFDLAGASWQFRLTRPTSRHHLAVAVDAAGCDVELVDGDGGDLLRQALAAPPGR